MPDGVATPARRINPEEARGRTSLFGREEPKPQPNKLQGRPSQVHFGDPIKPDYNDREAYAHWRPGREGQIFADNLHQKDVQRD